jgi:hypothetical protein
MRVIHRDVQGGGQELPFGTSRTTQRIEPLIAENAIQLDVLQHGLTAKDEVLPALGGTVIFHALLMKIVRDCG